MSIRTILLVDERERYRVPIRAVLESQGYRVYEADCGVEGLELTDSLRPDLVIADATLRLPTGVPLLEALSRGPGTDGLPVLVLAPTTVDELTGIHAAPVDCIGFPVRPREVLEVVERRIGKAVA